MISHRERDYPYNMKNTKAKLLSIYEENIHYTIDCVLNMKNKTNYHMVYQTQVVDQSQQNEGNYQNYEYNHQGRFNGHGQHNKNRGDTFGG